MNVKTAIIFLDTAAGITYYVVDGDLSRFNGVEINGWNDDADKDRLMQEFSALVYSDETGHELLESVSMQAFRQAIIEGALLIEAVFLA